VDGKQWAEVGELGVAANGKLQTANESAEVGRRMAVIIQRKRKRKYNRKRRKIT